MTLRGVRPGIELQLPNASFLLPPDAEIARVQITAGPHLGVPLGSDYPVLPIGDFEWILRSIQSSKDDL